MLSARYNTSPMDNVGEKRRVLQNAVGWLRGLDVSR